MRHDCTTCDRDKNKVGDLVQYCNFCRRKTRDSDDDLLWTRAGYVLVNVGDGK